MKSVFKRAMGILAASAIMLTSSSTLFSATVSAAGKFKVVNVDTGEVYDSSHPIYLLEADAQDDEWVTYYSTRLCVEGNSKDEYAWAIYVDPEQVNSSYAACSRFTGSSDTWFITESLGKGTVKLAGLTHEEFDTHNQDTLVVGTKGAYWSKDNFREYTDSVSIPIYVLSNSDKRVLVSYDPKNEIIGKLIVKSGESIIIASAKSWEFDPDLVGVALKGNTPVGSTEVNGGKFVMPSAHVDIKYVTKDEYKKKYASKLGSTSTSAAAPASASVKSGKTTIKVLDSEMDKVTTVTTKAFAANEEQSVTVNAGKAYANRKFTLYSGTGSKMKKIKTGKFNSKGVAKVSVKGNSKYTIIISD